MNREVAIKVLNAGFATDAERRTFERECHALGQLSHHPNIVTVFNDAITDDGRPCIVMELYPLELPRACSSRSARCRSTRCSPSACASAERCRPPTTRECCTATSSRTTSSCRAYGEPALGDFGISTIDDERSHSGASGLSVAYAAPEVLEDSRASPAADVYSLAATLTS